MIKKIPIPSLYYVFQILLSTLRHPSKINGYVCVHVCVHAHTHTHTHTHTEQQLLQVEAPREGGITQNCENQDPQLLLSPALTQLLLGYSYIYKTEWGTESLEIRRKQLENWNS